MLESAVTDVLVTMRVSRARIPSLPAMCVALASAMLLATPHEFDRVRPARAGSHRLDSADASHGPADDYASVTDTLASNGDGESDAGLAPGHGAALASGRTTLPSLSYVELTRPARPDRPLAPRHSLLPPGRAPPHA